MAGFEQCPGCGNLNSVIENKCPSCHLDLVPGREAKSAAAPKKSGWGKPLILFVVAIVSGAFLFLGGENLADLKKTDPAEYQRRVKELEALVAKVPATDIEQNIKLYAKLKLLNPSNVRYSEKHAYFTTKKREAVERLKRKEEAKKKAVEADRKRRGFHCLNSWDGSHSRVKKYTRDRMRDPKSFEHIETRIAPVKKGKHTLIMKYRAKNGFGGMSFGVTVAKIANRGCGATIVSVK